MGKLRVCLYVLTIHHPPMTELIIIDLMLHSQAINQNPTDERLLMDNCNTPLHCSTPKAAKATFSVQKRKCASPACSPCKPVAKKVKKNVSKFV